ncbi:hypothetical protein MKZ38_009563 [Zalerion maritima]|uniref:BTB domain-containing protein n=1 Tax=Zalerion maritima TaxID=339359 RepID=A0AAD5WSX7_9PEZI|nr:hypothetical protein MKZ38_009563 [Zalerion maritima]
MIYSIEKQKRRFIANIGNLFDHPYFHRPNTRTIPDAPFWDLQIRTSSGCSFAHSAVLLNEGTGCGDFFRKHIVSPSTEEEKMYGMRVVHLGNEDPDMVENILEFSYKFDYAPTMATLSDLISGGEFKAPQKREDVDDFLPKQVAIYQLAEKQNMTGLAELALAKFIHLALSQLGNSPGLFTAIEKIWRIWPGGFSMIKSVASDILYLNPDNCLDQEFGAENLTKDLQMEISADISKWPRSKYWGEIVALIEIMKIKLEE